MIRERKKVNSINYSLFKKKKKPTHLRKMESKVGQEPKFKQVGDIKAGAPPAAWLTAAAPMLLNHLFSKFPAAGKEQKEHHCPSSAHEAVRTVTVATDSCHE